MSDELQRDLHAYGGILLAGLGAGGFDWRAGLLLVGGTLAYLGIFHLRRR